MLPGKFVKFWAENFYKTFLLSAISGERQSNAFAIEGYKSANERLQNCKSRSLFLKTLSKAVII